MSTIDGPIETVKISQLPDATALAGPEYVPVVQDGQTRKTTMDDIKQTAQEWVQMTQAEYDAITPNPKTLYVIIG